MNLMHPLFKLTSNKEIIFYSPLRHISKTLLFFTSPLLKKSSSCLWKYTSSNMKRKSFEKISSRVPESKLMFFFSFLSNICGVWSWKNMKGSVWYVEHLCDDKLIACWRNKPHLSGGGGVGVRVGYCLLASHCQGGCPLPPNLFSQPSLFSFD